MRMAVFKRKLPTCIIFLVFIHCISGKSSSFKRRLSKSTQNIKLHKQSRAGGKHKGIYDSDTRKDVHEIEINSLHLKQCIGADVIVLDEKDLTLDQKTMTYSQVLSPYNTAVVRVKGKKKKLPLAPDENFRDQKLGGHCSGFLVGPQQIVTAGHCIDHSTCQKTAFRFNYHQGKGNTNPIDKGIPFYDIAFCASIESFDLNEEEETDYAVVNLQWAVPYYQPYVSLLPDIDDGKLSTGNPVTMIGHPQGLPMKLSESANIVTLDEKTLTADLDSYGGNSGSMVVGRSGDVVGILVSGQTDYEVTIEGKQYAKSKILSSGISNVDRFETVSRLSQFRGYVTSPMVRFPEFKMGQQAHEILAVKYLLLGKGYNSPEMKVANGESTFGENLSENIKSFQSDNELPISGNLVNAPLLSLLINEISIGTDGVSHAVKAAQVLLEERMVDFEIDLNDHGIFNDITDEFIMKFQLQSGITSDGVIGGQTWRYLFGGTFEDFVESDEHKFTDFEANSDGNIVSESIFTFTNNS